MLGAAITSLSRPSMSLYSQKFFVRMAAFVLALVPGVQPAIRVLHPLHGPAGGTGGHRIGGGGRRDGDVRQPVPASGREPGASSDRRRVAARAAARAERRTWGPMGIGSIGGQLSRRRAPSRLNPL